MLESLTHPGLSPIEQRSFDLYSKFINPDGLPTHLLDWFTRSLEFFYNQTYNSEIWLPLKCRLIDQELESFSLSFFPAEAQVRRFRRSHFWYEAKLPVRYGKILAVDPTGVINAANFVNGSHLILLASSYVPYFGLKDQAPPIHREIYLAGQPLDSLGTD